MACAIDANFLPHCAAMVHSLCAHHQPGRLTVHLLHDESLPRQDVVDLGHFVVGLGARWDACRVGPALSSGIPCHPTYGRAAWYRVLLPDLLPDLDRIIYLDADTIVMGSLDALWTTDLADHALGAVTNPLYPHMSDRFVLALGLPTVDQYFNSGVLLLNLSNWREKGHGAKVLEFARAGIGLDWWPDQNALNAILWRHRLALAPRWNASSVIFDLKPGQLPYSTQELIDARTNPAIVHFIGPHKPGHYRSKHPYAGLYFHHLDQTPWRGQADGGGRAVQGRTPVNVVLRLLPARWGLRLEAGVLQLFSRLGQLPFLRNKKN